MIANILNEGGYSNLQQFVKENVKAILSDNKIILSVTFAAVIQTIKTNPQVINLIYNIGTANNGEQHTDDNNNAIKYFEVNKNRLSDLTEKNYENLVEAITSNVIAETVTS